MEFLVETDMLLRGGAKYQSHSGIVLEFAMENIVMKSLLEYLPKDLTMMVVEYFISFIALYSNQSKEVWLTVRKEQLY